MAERTSLEQWDAPNIHTPLPGPKAKALIESDERVTSPSYTRVYPLAVKAGRGAVIEDLDGNRFLDFNAGIAVCATGHCHPRLVAAIQQQASQLLHMSGTDFYYPPQAELANKLAEIAPGPEPKRVFFTNSGAESVEAAVKLARAHTGRSQIVAFYGAFHGRTLGALSLTASKPVQRAKFGPLIPGVIHVPYAYCYRCPKCRPNGPCCLAGARELRETIFKRMVSPDEVAAIVVEPIQGEGGYIVPPAEFHQELRKIADEHGILLVADEVQSGMGRTGRMFAMQHFGVVPDIICLAKGIASGLPLGAIIAPKSIMDWPYGSHASTFGGNPVSCVAALETIALLEESLLDNAEQMGQVLMSGLQELQRKFPIIGDLRGKGLMIGAELVKDPDTREPAPELRNAIVQNCFHRGLLLLGCGESTLRFSPPLIIQEPQIHTALTILEASLRELT